MRAPGAAVVQPPRVRRRRRHADRVAEARGVGAREEEVEELDVVVAERELALRGVITREDLAEQSIDDLLDIDGIDEERAGKLIMAARVHWFE